MLTQSQLNKLLLLQDFDGSLGFKGFNGILLSYSYGKRYPASSPLFKRNVTPLSALKEAREKVVVMGVVSGGQLRTWTPRGMELIYNCKFS